MEKKNPIEEARRYVQNAKTALVENGEYDPTLRRYEDRKNVRAAGHYLWHAVLIAIDAVFHVRKDRRTRVDIDTYREAVGDRDRKLLSWMNDGYNVMHLSMDYDGTQAKSVCDTGFRLANDIIDRCERLIEN